MDDTEKPVARLQHNHVGWLIYEKTSRYGREYFWPYPVCRSCQIDLDNPTAEQLVCKNPRCKKKDEIIDLGQLLSESQRLVAAMYKADLRKKDKMQWLNYDQELVPLAEGKDSDSEHWCTVKLLQTTTGKVAMVLLGKKGAESKVQFFVKDGLDQVNFDQVGDLHPKEVVMAFRADFSDGSTTETRF